MAARPQKTTTVAATQANDTTPAQKPARQPRVSKSKAAPPAQDAQPPEVVADQPIAAAPEIVPATTPATAKGKLGALVGLMMRPEGATLAVMSEATGWQAHSVRGAMSGSLKKKLGFEITSEKTEAGRIYRIAKGVGA